KRKLGNMIKFKYESEEIPIYDNSEILSNISLIIEYCDLGLRRDLGNGDLRFASEKIISYVKNQLERLVATLTFDTDYLFWISRNLFEIRLLCRHYYASLDKITEWHLLSFADHEKIYQIFSGSLDN